MIFGFTPACFSAFTRRDAIGDGDGGVDGVGTRLLDLVDHRAELGGADRDVGRLVDDLEALGLLHRVGVLLGEHRRVPGGVADHGDLLARRALSLASMGRAT